MKCSAFFITIVFLLIGCSEPNTPEEYSKKAKIASANAQYTKAILFYKNALKEDPSLIKARFELGAIYLLLGDLSSAENSLQTVHDAGYFKEQTVPLLAATFFQQNNMVALEQLLNEQKNDEISTDFNLHMALYKVLLFSRNGQVKQAQKKFNELDKTFVKSTLECELCQLTQAILQSYNSPSAALNTLNKLRLTYPKNAQATLLRGQLYFALHNPTEAMKNFKRFQALQPRAGYVQFLIAVTALQMKDKKNATKYVDNLLAANPAQPLVNHLKALLVFDKKDYKAAQIYAEQSINRGLKSPANYLIAGVSAYHQESMEIAYGHLRKAVVSYPENQQLQRLVMFIQIRFGYLDKASDSYLKQDQRSVKDVLFGNLMAYQFMQKGQFDEAGSVINYLENTPISQPAIRLQTQALKNQLKLKEVIPLTELTSQSPSRKVKNTNAEKKLIRLMLFIESNQITKAQNEAQQWLAKEPNNTDALNILAYIFQQLAQPEKAKPLFEQALTINPQNTPSLFFLAQQALLHANIEQARLHYRTILKINPNNLSALRSLLQLTFNNQQEPNWDEILQLLDLAIISDDQIIAIVDTMFRWKKHQGIETFLASTKPQSQWSDLLWMAWLKNSLYLDGTDKFQDNFNKFHQKNSLQGHVLFALSVIESQQQYPLMLKLINSLAEPLQNTEAIQMQKAFALIELKRFDRAENILSHFEQSQNLQSIKWYMKGRLMENRGDLAQAASYLTTYYQALPSFHSVNSLANVLIKENRYNDVVSLAKEYIKGFPTDSSTCLSLALKLAPTHPKFALTLFKSEHVQWLIKQNWKLSNNVAWLYLSQNEPKTAVNYSTNALILNPDSNHVRLVHANILIKLKQVPQAVAILKAAKQPDIAIQKLIKQLI